MKMKYLLFVLLASFLLVSPVLGGVVLTNFTTGSYTGEIFTYSGAGYCITTFTPPAGSTGFEFVLVGGGGAGNAAGGSGGGGGGGFVNGSYPFTPLTPYTVTIGNGGQSNGVNGCWTSFGSITALGGGGYNTVVGSCPSAPVGSGAGGYYGVTPGCPGTTGQGLSGGNAFSAAPNYGGGGGGGNGTIGANAVNPSGGAGGDGVVTRITGLVRVVSAGGGGSAELAPGGIAPGGSGGVGGDGGNAGSVTPPTDGDSNTGSGGGGGFITTYGRGGSGIAIIRYLTGPVSSFTSNKTTSQTAPFGVQFNDTSSQTPAMWNWSVNTSLTSVVWSNFSGYPDHGALDERNITYTFPAVGHYRVNLTVSNETPFPGITSTASMYIFGNATLQAGFNRTPSWGHTFTTVNFVDMSTGADLYNWSWDLGFLGNTSYVRNPSFQYNKTGNYNVNLTVKGSDGQSILNWTSCVRINTNNTFTVVLRDAETFALITNPVTVKLSISGVDYTQSITSTGIVEFELPDDSYDVMASAVPGVYSSAIGSVVMSGTDATGTLYMTPVVSTQGQTMFNSPHQVRWMVADRFGNKQVGVTVTATPIDTTVPDGNWFTTMFGLSTSTAPVINATAMSGTTGTDGAIVFIMIGSIQYDMQFTSVPLGINHLIRMNPVETGYTIWVVTTSTVSPINCGLLTTNASLFPYVSTVGYTDLNLTYVDASLTTTNLTFFVNNPTGTQLYSTSFFNTPAITNQTVSTNWTVANTAGMQYVWGYFANSTTCGNLTSSQGITLKGPTGRLVELDPCKGYTLGWDSTC